MEVAAVLDASPRGLEMRAMRGAWLEIDLGAYRRNITRLREFCGGAAVLAVVKANAYGHGLIPTGCAALEAGAWGLGVAIPEEGLALRDAGIAAPVVVLGPWPLDQAEQVVHAGLDTVIGEPHIAATLALAARRAGVKARLHVKVDTGMTRAGVGPEAALDLCRQIWEAPNLELVGVLTHFSYAEEREARETRSQWSLFAPLVERIRALAPRRTLFHAANSAAALWLPESRLDMVRPGLVTYGISPADRRVPFPVQPALALRGRVTQLRWVEAGRQVGYGGTFKTRRPSRLAVVPLGYADGLPWRLSGQGWALVRGRRVPIVGRVSMDQVVLDLTALEEVAPEETATFIGRDGSEEISVTEVAEAAGTIAYEVLTRLSERLPRVYRG